MITKAILTEIVLFLGHWSLWSFCRYAFGRQMPISEIAKECFKDVFVAITIVNLIGIPIAILIYIWI